MDSKTKTDVDKIIYLDEMHDEPARPLTSNNTEAIPSVFSRASFTAETEDLANNSRDTSRRSSISRTAIGFDGNDKTVIGFVDSSGPELLSPAWSVRPNIQLSTPDVNVYQHKKTLAQGMMDLALLSANANQMHYILQTDGRHSYFYPALTMISMSLLLQIVVGIGLIWNSVYDVKEHEQMRKANKANNWTVIGIFLVTILNVFISSFGIVDQDCIPIRKRERNSMETIAVVRPPFLENIRGPYKNPGNFATLDAGLPGDMIIRYQADLPL